MQQPEEPPAPSHTLNALVNILDPRKRQSLTKGEQLTPYCCICNVAAPDALHPKLHSLHHLLQRLYPKP